MMRRSLDRYAAYSALRKATMRATMAKPNSLALLSFKVLCDNNVRINKENSFPDFVRYDLCRQLITVSPTYSNLKLYYEETKRFDVVLMYLTRWDFKNDEWSSEHIENTLGGYISRDLTNLTPNETLEFIGMYTQFGDYDKTYTPKCFFITWRKDYYGLCRWCSPQILEPVPDDARGIELDCCGVIKLLCFHNYGNDDMDLEVYVKSVDSYCERCNRPLFNIVDMDSSDFALDLFFCTECEE